MDKTLSRLKWAICDQIKNILIPLRLDKNSAGISAPYRKNSLILQRLSPNIDIQVVLL